MHCFLNIVVICLVISVSQCQDRVREQDLTALTFFKDKITIRRRTSPTSQIQCVGGTAACAFVPDVVQCKNQGFDGRSVQWRCTANMDKAYTLQRTNVKCEGYDKPGDTDVLSGSCRVELTIDKTGYKPSGGGGGGVRPGGGGYYPDYHHKKFGFGLWNIIFLVVILIVVGVIVKACISNRHPFMGGGGTGTVLGGGPTTFVQQPIAQPGFNPGYPGAQPYGAAPYAQPYVQPVGGGGSSGPGFMTGAAAGAATGGLLGYMFGRNNTGHDYDHHHYGGGGGYMGGGGYNGGGGGGGMFDSTGNALSGDVVESAGFGDTTIE